MPKPKFQVGDYVKLTPEWAAELEDNSACTTFRPFIYGSFAITLLASSGDGCYIRPLHGAGAQDYKHGFWFSFNKLRVDPFLGNAQKAIRDA